MGDLNNRTDWSHEHMVDQVREYGNNPGMFSGGASGSYNLTSIPVAYWPGHIDTSQYSRNVQENIALAGVTAAGLSVAGVAVMAIPEATATAPIVVSRWGREGLEKGDWVMKGGKNWWNYFWSGKWQPGAGNRFAAKKTGESFEVPPTSLRPPRMGDVGTQYELPITLKIKNLLGQNIFDPE